MYDKAPYIVSFYPLAQQGKPLYWTNAELFTYLSLNTPINTF